jgi:glutathione synthase/RimK-type ligase-like ATP-grasp enzyme
MRPVVVVSSPSDWPLSVSGVEVVRAKDYLTDPGWMKNRGTRVFNLCRSYRYQSEGYYVSLLATARRHRPFPDLMTVLDMKSRALVRTVDEELDALIKKSLADIRSERFELSIYFGQNLAERHDALARRLFSQFPAPLLRAQFTRGERWRLASIGPIPFREVPETHWDFVLSAARSYFTRKRHYARVAKSSRYDLAILHDPREELAPSRLKTLKRFANAAEELGFAVELIQREDYGRLAEFDALFIRETTAVNHHTFRFAQRAESEGLVVIDDPHSILRCTNKVFQTEAFELRDVPTPKTWITDHVDVAEVVERIGLPCVLKVPDSAFSQGVVKCSDATELTAHAERILDESDLLLVQEYTPSEFDWRVGVFEGEALWACRYHMARGHWQIMKREADGDFRFGNVDTLPLDQVPARVVKIALRAAATIGDGLYGVDLKQLGKRVVVTEVNDNPNIDVGFEDSVLKDALYSRIMGGFLRRVEEKKRRGNGR